MKPRSILKNSTLPEIKKLLNLIEQEAVEKELLEELWDQFEQFLKYANVKILKFEAEAILEVFDDYFDRQQRCCMDRGGDGIPPFPKP